jgi:hypothetical protein
MGTMQGGASLGDLGMYRTAQDLTFVIVLAAVAFAYFIFDWRDVGAGVGGRRYSTVLYCIYCCAFL